MSSLPDDVSIQVSRIDAAFYDKLSAFFIPPLYPHTIKTPADKVLWALCLC